MAELLGHHGVIRVGSEGELHGICDNFWPTGDSPLQPAHQTVGNPRGALSQGEGRYGFAVPVYDDEDPLTSDRLWFR